MEEKPWRLEPPEGPHARRRGRVLMLDDDADMLAVLKAWLGERYDAEGLTDWRMFIAAALSYEPDLVILDIGLPGSDGYALCAELRRTKPLAGVPVLFLTGHSTSDDFLARLDVGGDAFLRKPVTREDLLLHVEGLLS